MIKCEFYTDNTSKCYNCYISYQEIPSEVSQKSFIGSHEKKRSNDDVQKLNIEGSECQKFPSNLGEVFKNVTWLRIWNSKLREISKENLKQFSRLEILDLSGNQIEKIPRDLFEFNKKLKEINLRSNKIQIIESGTLENLLELEEFYIGSNQLEFIPGDFFKANRKMRKIGFYANKIKFIGPELLDGLIEISYVDLRENQTIDIKFDKNEGHNYLRLSEIQQKLKNFNAPLELFKALNSLRDAQCQLEILVDRKELKDDLIKFLTFDELKDFTIKIDSRTFKVHKILFAARSEVFANLIKSEPNLSEWKITEISPETFEVILKFLYTDEAPKDPKNARKIFSAAEKLKIRKLKEISAKILIEEIKKVENLREIWEIFNLGLKFNHEELKLKAFVEIQGNFTKNTLKDEILNFPEKLRQIVEAKIILEEKLKTPEEISARTLKALLDEMETRKDLKFLLETFNVGVKNKSQKLKLKAFEEIKNHFKDQKLSDDLLESPENLNDVVNSKLTLDELLGSEKENLREEID